MSGLTIRVGAGHGPLAVTRALWQRLLEFDATMSEWRQTVLLAALVGLFFLLAGFSFVDATVAAAACAVLVGATAILLPRMGLLLIVACVPVQALFSVSRSQMQVVLAVGLLCATIRHLYLIRRFVVDRKPAVVVILAIFVLVFAVRTMVQAAFMPSDILLAVVKEGVFYACLVVVALACYRYAADQRFRCGLMLAVALILALTILLDSVVTYFPSWSGIIEPTRSWSGLRFAGLHINPNATAKFLLAAVAIAVCAVLVARTPTAKTLALTGLVAATLALSATLSKSTLIGAFVACTLFLAYAALQRHWRQSLSIAGVVVLMLGVSAAWEIVIFPWVAQATTQSFATSKGLPAAKQQISRPAELVATRVQKELRIYQSYAMTVEKPVNSTRPNSEMYRNIPGQITYTKRDCGWSCAGQRDRLWGAGFAIVRDHWLLGIGPGYWPLEYQNRLAFPFDSPHNGLLELWGGYGLAGLLLYLALVANLLRLCGKSFRSFGHSVDPVFAPAVSLFMLAILLTELFDPAKFLAMNPHTVWLWMLLASLERAVELEPESRLWDWLRREWPSRFSWHRV